MLMLEQRIQQQFFESADLLSHCADPLSRPLAQAAQTLLGSITAGNKLVFVGAGASSALAGYGAALFIGQFERERPPLPAMALGTSTWAGSADWAEARALEVRALGVPGDVLLALGTGAAAEQLLACVRAAQAKEMTVLALTDGQAVGLTAALSETDVHLAVAHERASRVNEAHLLVLNALADAIDLQLMGEQDTP